MRSLRWKKLLTVLLAAAVLLTTFSTVAMASPKWTVADNENEHENEHGNGNGNAFGRHFEDEEEAPWAADIIERVFEKGFIKGVDSKHFQPNKPVTKIEAAIMITRMLGLEDQALQSLQGKLPFIDDGDIPTWARGYVDLMVAQGILSGIDTGHGKELKGNKPATRLEVTVMIIRALGLEDQAKANDGSSLTFTDKAAIPSSLLGYVALAVDKGIITGVNGTFQPNKPVTRAEMAAILDRASGNTPAPQPGTVTGTFVSATTSGAQTITIKKTDNTQTTYQLADTATVTLNGAASTLASLQANDSVSLTVGADDKVTAVAATRTTSVSGTFVSATTSGTQTITVKKADNTQVTYILAANAAITLNGAASTLAQLQANDAVALTLGADNKVTAVAATRNTTTVSGTFVSATTSGTQTITVRKADNTQMTYIVAANAAITLNGAASTLASLQANDAVALTLAADGTATAIAATRIQTVVGTVYALSASTITVKKADNTIVSYQVAANATITLNGAVATPAQLQVNDSVNVTVGADGTATAIAATRAYTVTGTVYSAAASMIAIKKADNTVVSYQVATNATITLNGAAATLAQLQTNDNVTATVGTDGKVYSLVATRGDQTVANMALTLTANKAIYTSGEVVNLSFTVKNNNSAAVTVLFPTTQMYDFVVTQNGATVWTWSAGQQFNPNATSMTLAAGQSLTFQCAWNQTNAAGQLVAAGQYAAKASFLGKVNNQTLADQTVQFTIQQP